MPISDSTKPLLDPADATVALEQVSSQVDALIAAWESPERPPPLSKFLPERPLELRRLVLTELIKVDLEYRWQQHGLPKMIEEYLTEFPELAETDKVPCDLIYEEYLIRRRTAEPPIRTTTCGGFRPKPSNSSGCSTFKATTPRRWPSAAAARRTISASRSTISMCCCGWAKGRLRRSTWPGSVRCSGWWR